MTGKTHQIIGIGVGLATYFTISQPTYSPATLAAVLAFSSIGALLPDIDNGAAQIWHSIPFGVGHVAAKIVDPFLEHRNITHSLVGMALIGMGLFYLLGTFPIYWGINSHVVLISALAAYASYLLADSVTVEGIPLFWPIQWMIGIPPKPFDGIRIVTGKWFENLVVFPIVNIALIFLIVNNWQNIQTILFHS